MTERSGKPVVCALTAGQRHESPEAIPLLQQALDRLWPDAVTGDKGYSSTEIRNWLQAREIEAVIPRRKDEMEPNLYDRALYRERSRVEQAINRLKRWRRVATRYEKLAATYLAMVTIAMILEWV